jgi:hypothetical protein
MQGESGSRYVAVSEHALACKDPVLARFVQGSLSNHIVPTTQSGYDCAVRQYVKFCTTRAVDPWPPDPIWIAGWIVLKTMHVSVRTMKVYLCAVRSHTIDLGLDWVLCGNPLVARAMRASKRRYGMTGSALKVPISLSTLALMCNFLPGWPVSSLMSHDDILWVCASSIAIVGFLRGGEFLASVRSSRPLLRTSDVYLTLIDGVDTVCIRIDQPKARWWLTDNVVCCFDMGPSCPVNPSVWLRRYRLSFGGAAAPKSPAFVLSSGFPLSRNWMLARTSRLLTAASVSLVDSTGAIVVLKMSSWRAGGVQSAKAAGVSDAVIRAMGRWSSDAWINYCYATREDLRRATVDMWQVPNARPPTLVVGSFSPAGLFTDDT